MSRIFPCMRALLARRCFVPITALLVGCGGSSGGPPVTPTRPDHAKNPISNGAPASAAAPVTFSITVPNASNGASPSSRRRQYVSLATGSIAINPTVAGSFAPVTHPIRFGEPGCSPVGVPTLTCTITVNAPPGPSIGFAIATFENATATGTPLATKTLYTAVNATSGGNVALDLDGVVSSLAISPSTVHAANDGSTSRVSLSVVALDAAGAVIVGPNAYTTPISLNISGDSNGALSLDRTSLAGPGNVVVTYRSAIPLDHAKILLTAGTTQASADVTTLSIRPAQTPLIMHFDDPATKVATVYEYGQDAKSLSFFAFGQEPQLLSDSPVRSSYFTVSATPNASGSIDYNATPPHMSTLTSVVDDLGIPFSLAQENLTFYAYDGYSSVQVSGSLLYSSKATFAVITNPLANSETFPFVENPVIAPNGDLWFITADASGHQYYVAVNAADGSTTKTSLPKFGLVDATGNTLEAVPPSVSDGAGHFWFAAVSASRATYANYLPISTFFCRFTIADGAVDCVDVPSVTNSLPMAVRADASSVIGYIQDRSNPATSFDVITIDPVKMKYSIGARLKPDPSISGAYAPLDGAFSNQFINTLATYNRPIVIGATHYMEYNDGSTQGIEANDLQTGKVIEYPQTLFPPGHGFGARRQSTITAPLTSDGSVLYAAYDDVLFKFDPVSTTYAHISPHLQSGTQILIDTFALDANDRFVIPLIQGDISGHGSITVPDFYDPSTSSNIRYAGYANGDGPDVGLQSSVYFTDPIPGGYIAVMQKVALDGSARGFTILRTTVH